MKKLALFAIIVLIFGTMSPSLVNHAYGQNDPSILLRIAIQADKQIVNQLDKKYENKMPNNINILYDKGHRAVKSLDQSLSNNDIERNHLNGLVKHPSPDIVYFTSSNSISSSSSLLRRHIRALEQIKTMSTQIDKLVTETRGAQSKSIKEKSPRAGLTWLHDSRNKLLSKNQQVINERNTLEIENKQ